MEMLASTPLNAGSWSWLLDRRRKLAELREKATALFIQGKHAEFIECSDEAANLERSINRGQQS